VPRRAFCDGHLDCSDSSDEMLTTCSKTLQVLNVSDSEQYSILDPLTTDTTHD
jgi:hypothetical protein